MQKSRAVYSLDDNDEPDLPKGRDPTLEEKDADQEETEGVRQQQPRWITTRNRSGVVRTKLSQSYATHVAGRLEGRDKFSGFRSPFGTDYVPVGGPVSAMHGNAIRDHIAGGWQSSIRASINSQPIPKTNLPLEHAQDFQVKNYAFRYFLLDLSDRPLEHAPKRSLIISFTVVAGSGEAYVSMEGEHEYPTNEKYTWKFDFETSTAGNEGSTDRQFSSIQITPSDPAYSAMRNKRVVLAVRSELGFLEYRIKAVMQTFLSGSGIAAMLENRGTKKKLEQEERARELQDVKDSISHSYTRCKYASVGKEPPPPRRPFSATQNESSTPMLQKAESPLPLFEEEKSTKTKSMASMLDSTLSAIEANPVEFMKQEFMKQEEAKRIQKAALEKTVGGETNRGGEQSSRAGEQSSRESQRQSSRRSSTGSFELNSARRSARSAATAASAAGKKKGKGPAHTDEDMIALDKGQWTKLVLKARVPAAMRLQWGVQEIEVEKGKRTGETPARKYVKTTSRDVRKRDQDSRMSEVLVSTMAGHA